MDEDLLIMTEAGLECHCPDGEDKDVLSSFSLIKEMLLLDKGSMEEFGC